MIIFAVQSLNYNNILDNIKFLGCFLDKSAEFSSFSIFGALGIDICYRIVNIKVDWDYDFISQIDMYPTKYAFV